jgi:hypothetical protein
LRCRHLADAQVALNSGWYAATWLVSLNPVPNRFNRAERHLAIVKNDECCRMSDVLGERFEAVQGDDTGKGQELLKRVDMG